ncbi:MAG: hypothetical protein F9K38_14900 [Pseudorhodoplanes sp.]|nr:MAG: hypothetical protein F9K38_14900 [Pseudorhodoplanes sp.]
MFDFAKFGRCRATVTAFALAVVVFGPSQHVRAAEQPNLLIVGEDADHDTVPRGSRIFNRVLAALTTDMNELGFKVYDETAAGMDITNPGRVRRTDAELISVAQRIPQPPIDVVVGFQIYASVQQNAYSDIKELRVRIAGRMVQVQTAKALGNFEVAVGPRGLKPLPVNCNRNCVLEHVGNEAKPIAHEVGIVLARKLDELSPGKAKRPTALTEPAPAVAAAPPPAPAPGVTGKCVGLSTAFTIVLKGYDPEETSWIEQTLIAFQGYEHHRPVRSQTRMVEYWYETCSDHARLERNLRVMVEQLSGQNRMALSGHRFEVEKIASVGKR